MKQIITIIILFLLFTFSVSALENSTYGSGLLGAGILGLEDESQFGFSGTVNLDTTKNLTFGSNQTNVTLDIIANTNASGFINIIQYNSQPSNVGKPSATSLNKYIEIDIASSLNNTINYSILKLKYSDAEVSSANLNENTMRLYRWDGSNWIKFDGSGSGIDTSNKIVFANTTQFSTWGIFGNVVPVPEQPKPEPSESSSGGGGGAAAVTTVMAESSHFWQRINPNQVFSLKPKDEAIAIIEVEITNGDKELKNVELGVQALIQNPVSQEPIGNVYQYLRINKRNIDSKDIKQIKIFFDVSSDWKNKHSIDEAYLMRFEDGKWEKINTQEESGHYSAVLNKFSLFAVVGTGKEHLFPIVPIGGLNIEEESKIIEIETSEIPPEIEEPEGTRLAWIISAIVIVVGIILIVVYQKNKRQN